MSTRAPATMEAPAAQEQWDDLYFRHNFADTGMYPTSGSLSQSPDVIPAGDKPYGEPSQLIADVNWMQDFGSGTTAQQANYIYLRGRNLGAQETEGKLYLYWSPASLLLFPTDPLDPTKGWSRRPLRTSQGAEYVTVRPKGEARFVSPEPFRWVPEPIRGDHYCLIGRVVTDRHPNEIPTTGNLNDFARYISTHPNLAWRNVVTMNPSNPTWTSETEYDQGDIGGEVIINMQVVNAPDGSEVGYSSGTTGPVPPIYQPMTRVQNHQGSKGPTFDLPLVTTIPANFHTWISYTWDSKGKTPLPDMTVTFSVIMPDPATYWDPELDRYAVSLEALGIERVPIGPTRGIRLGSQTLVGLRPAPRDAALARSAVEAGKSSILVAGFRWTETTTSVVSTSRSAYDVALTRVPDRGVETEVLTLAETSPPAQAVAGVADIIVDVDFNEGAAQGTSYFLLTTERVPVGCQVWFENTTGDVPIKVPPTRVNNATRFAVGLYVDLPPDYQCRIRMFLDRDGQELPADWTMKLTAYHVDAAMDPEANEPRPRVVVGAGPSPGVLLGSVTAKR